MNLVIVCRNCAEVFRLLRSIQEEKSEGLPRSSKEIEHQAFWCWICGTVFPYTAQDCHWEDDQKLAPGQRPVGKAAFRTAFQCDRENCAAPVVVNTITDDGPTADELRERAFQMHGKAVCQEGHEFSVQPAQRDLHFDRIAAGRICKFQ